jgi:hypothetical protein
VKRALFFTSLALLACNSGSVTPTKSGSASGSASGATGGQGGMGAPGATGGVENTTGGVAGANTGGTPSNPETGGATSLPTSGGAPNSGGQAGANGGTSSTGGATSDSPDGSAPSTLTHDETLIPDKSWDCGMPDGIPPPDSGVLVFQATTTLGQIYDIGTTQYGHRTLTEINGGTVTGSNINATLMSRGLDYQLALSNGALEIEELNILQTTDGVPIYLRTCGTAPDGASEVRIVPDFEAPTASAYAFLNTGKYVGLRAFDPVKKTLTFSVYDVTSVTPPTASVTVHDPVGVSDQSYDCKVAAGTQGAVVYTESVGIAAGSVAVGASKRGTRNIIPITGGTTTGRVAGSVLSGGADYQLIGATFDLDARYTLHTNDGELIIVRNCGPLGGLVPVFETRIDGPYAWLNANTWLSSDPGIGAGVVNLTIYDGG